MCIVFLHYTNTEVVLYNYELIIKNNPYTKIHSVGFDGNFLIEGSHVVFKTKYPKNYNLTEWSEADLLIYDFYVNYPNYDSYFFIEWDTYCNCSIENYYNIYLDKDFFSPHIVIGEKLKDWYWYTILSEEQKSMQMIGGVSPTTCLFFKNKVLKSVTDKMFKNTQIYENMFSEIRLGTLIQQCEYNLFEYGGDKISWLAENIKVNVNVPGYYHPVKSII